MDPVSDPIGGGTAYDREEPKRTEGATICRQTQGLHTSSAQVPLCSHFKAAEYQ